MTDEQFEKFMSMIQSQMQAQTDALQAQANALDKLTATLCGTEDGAHSGLCSEIKFLRKAEILKAALDLCKSRTTDNLPLQEQGGLTGSIEDISAFVSTDRTPENWKEYTTSETYVKTFSGKPLKTEQI